MKKFILGLVMMNSVSAFAAPIELDQGNGIVLTGTVVQIDANTTQLSGLRFYVDGDRSNVHSIKGSKRQAQLLCNTLELGVPTEFTTNVLAKSPITFHQARKRVFFEQKQGEGLLRVTCTKP